MHSLIIAGQNDTKLQTYIKQWLQKEHIDILDTTNIAPEKSDIGISEIRHLQTRLYLKPYKSKQKAIILQHFETATIQAQNALLKTLEEPPANTIIILAVSNSNSLLATIVSRCFIINLDNVKEKQEENQKNEIAVLNQLHALKSLSPADRLKMAQDLGKQKQTALNWLKLAILTARKQLRNSDTLRDNSTTKIITSFQKGYTTIDSTNVNPRFILENLFLNL